MGTATPTSGASATIHTAGGSLRFLPALGTAVGVAVLLKVVYEPWFLNYDARYALVWARDLGDWSDPGLRGSVRAHAAPAGDCRIAVAVPFGTGGDAIMSWAVLLCFGALVWLAFPSGGAVLGPGGRGDRARGAHPAGARAHALLGYQDTAFAVVVVWAVLLEARRPRRGAPVLLLLAVAG